MLCRASASRKLAAYPENYDRLEVKTNPHSAVNDLVDGYTRLLERLYDSKRKSLEVLKRPYHAKQVCHSPIRAAEEG